MRNSKNLFSTRGIALLNCLLLSGIGFARPFTSTQGKVIEAEVVKVTATEVVLKRNNPLSPPAAPVQGRLQGPPAKSKFLAVKAAVKRLEKLAAADKPFFLAVGFRGHPVASISARLSLDLIAEV